MCSYWYVANSSFAFGNFLDFFFFLIFSIHSWLSLWTWNPGVRRADCTTDFFKYMLSASLSAFLDLLSHVHAMRATIMGILGGSEKFTGGAM